VVWKLHYGEGKLVAVSIGGEEGRRRALRVELWGDGDHVGGGGALAVLCDGDWVGEDQEAEGERFGASVWVGDGRTEEVDGELAATLMACGVLSVHEQGSVPCYSEPREGMELLEGLGVSVAPGTEGRPRAVARASVRPGSFVATAASRSGIEAGAERSEEGRAWGQRRPQRGGSSGRRQLRQVASRCACGRGNDALLGSVQEPGKGTERRGRKSQRV